jgi:hypothetical protein
MSTGWRTERPGSRLTRSSPPAELAERGTVPPESATAGGSPQRVKWPHETPVIQKVVRAVRAWRRPGRHTRAPVPFIVGTGRCGTTLLRMMLDAHPQLAIPPETHFVSRLASLSQNDPHARGVFLSVVLTNPRWPDFHLDEYRLTRGIDAIDPFDPAEAVREFHRLYAARFGKPRWGNKTPIYLLHMRAIAGLLPEAHFIHVIRDGRDVALSIGDLWFGPRSIDDTAHWWRARVEEGWCQAAGLAHYVEVRYEDLIVDPEGVLRRLCRFLDLPWSPVLLEYHERAASRLAELDQAIATPDGLRIITAPERQAIFASTTREPDPRKCGRWRTEMSAADQATFERIAGDTLSVLGYPLGRPGVGRSLPDDSGTPL